MVERTTSPTELLPGYIHGISGVWTMARTMENIWLRVVGICMQM